MLRQTRLAMFLAPLAVAVTLTGSCGGDSLEDIADVDPVAAAAQRYADARRFSVADYGSVTARAIPVADAAESALRSFVPTRLIARELDLIEDDEIHRDGVAVLLGYEGDHLVALTTRRSVDAAYPSPKLINDGFGSAEIGDQWIEFRSSADGCETDGSGLGCPGTRLLLASQTGAKPSDAAVQTFGQHDVALVYLPRDSPGLRGRPTLGLSAPTERIKAELARSEQLFGLEFTLMSPASLGALQGAIPSQSTGGKLLVFAAVVALDPVVGAALGSLDALDPIILSRLEGGLAKLGAEQLEQLVGPLMDRVEGATGEGISAGYVEQLARVVEPGAAELIGAEELTIRDDGRLDWPGGENAELLGVELAGPDSILEARGLLQGMVGGADLMVVDFGDAGVLVLVPSERLVLNMELLAHHVGTVRAQPGVAASFPELVRAGSIDEPR